MDLQISIDELRKRKLFIAVPMYGGMCCGLFMKSCLDLQGVLSHYGIESRFSFIFNESLITRARNYLADEFIRSGFSHMIFIDSDIHFDPRDVLALLAMDKDIIGAPYPKKSIKWWAIKEAIQKQPDIQPGELEKLVGDFVFNAVGGTNKFQITEPVQVLELGTGYMMIKREVFEKWQKQYPLQSYKPDHVGQQHFDGSRYIHAFFDCQIDRKRDITYTKQVPVIEKQLVKEVVMESVTEGGMEIQKPVEKEVEKEVITGYKEEQVTNTVGGSDRYLSEDYFFCQQWRNMGGEIWLCPWMKTMHIGTYAFQGDLAAHANYLGKL